MLGKGKEMWGSNAPEWLKDGALRSLVDLRSRVSPEGDAAVIRVDIKDGCALNIRLDAGQLINVYHEIWHAAATVTSRQKLRVGVDRTMAELRAAALEPAEAYFKVDSGTGNLLAIHSFFNHAPVIFSVSPIAVLNNIGEIEAAMRRAHN